jgi:hypothetical protein
LTAAGGITKSITEGGETFAETARKAASLLHFSRYHREKAFGFARPLRNRLLILSLVKAANNMLSVGRSYQPPHIKSDDFS